MDDFAVRQAALPDIDALASLFDGYRRFYACRGDIAAARAFLHDRLHRGESLVFLAYDGETPIGFCQLFPSFSSVSMARTYILNDLFVREDRRRRGVASALLDAAVAHARSTGVVRVTLSTAVTNESAQALYQSKGWKRDEQFLVYHYAMPAGKPVLNES